MTENSTANHAAGGDWPLLTLMLPGGAEDEQTARLTQAAAEAGALGAHAEAGRLCIYLPRDSDAARIEAIRAAIEAEGKALGWPLDGGELGHLPDAPWATAWRATFVNLAIGRRLVIRPDWEQSLPLPAGLAGRTTIWLRPGLGFGTGRHESTHLALLLLEREIQPGMRVLDFGSGSGVLGLATLRLGAAAVVGIEPDADANENARENFALNELADRVRIIEANHPGAAAGPFDLVVCNILPVNARPHFAALAAALGGGGAPLIYSGFLTDQKNEVEADLRRAGVRVRAHETLNEWSAVSGTREV